MAFGFDSTDDSQIGEEEFSEDSSAGVSEEAVTETFILTERMVQTEVKKVKTTRNRRVKQTAIDPSELVVAKPRKTLKPRKDKRLRTLYKEMLSNLDLATLKRPWMATKSLRLVDSDQALKEYVDNILLDRSRWIAPYKGAKPCPVVAVDTETIGLDTRILVDVKETINIAGNKVYECLYEAKIELAGVCLSHDGISGIYIPLNHEKGCNVSREALRYHMQRLFNVSHLVFYHAKFDREVLRVTCDIKFREYPHFEDVQVLQFSNDPKVKLDDDSFSGESGGLKALSKDKLGIDQIELGHIGKVSADWCPVTNGGDCRCTPEERKATKHGSRVQYVPFTWIPTDIALPYAAADAICTWLLWFDMREEAQSRVRVHRIDGDLVDSLTWIERQRFRIAEEPHGRVMRWHMRTMEERREKLRQIAIRHGWQELTDDDGNVIAETRFNVDKKHLPHLLFGVKKMEVVKKSEKTGAPSVDKEAMVDLLKKYPTDEFLLALDEYKKYVALHPENLKYDPKDHSARIYLKQCTVAGGRLAAAGGKFDRDGGFGLNVQAIKKVGGNRFVYGRILDPDFVPHDQIDHYEEADLHPSCLSEVEESVITGWLETRLVHHPGADRLVEETTVLDKQFPDDIDATQSITDAFGDTIEAPKYGPDSFERNRKPIYEKRKVIKQAPGIINNHIANYLGYSICLVPKCKTCAEKHGILIEKGKLDANQVINLRALFVADKGWTFLSTDYSNIEMRVAANVSGEPKFIHEFLFGSGDFHSLTASVVFPEFNDPATSKAVRKSCRDLAKIINFALLYGGTKYTIYENMRKKRPDITMKDTEKMVAAYWEGVPVFKAFCDEQQRIAREQMICTTATGRLIRFDSAMKNEGIRVPTDEEWQRFWAYTKIRKRQREAEAEGNVEEAAHLKEVMDEAWKDPTSGVRNAQDYNRFMSKIQRVAVNVPLQGLAGDFMRMAINRVRKWATQKEPLVQAVLRMHGSVHDELDYAVKNPYLPFVIPRITRLMKLRKLHEQRQWTVPIECDTEYGASWDVAEHLTGDSDHIPAGWTAVEGLEEYLPEFCSIETLDALSRALASGKQIPRDGVEAWAKENLHKRAFEAFWHAMWFLDREKKPQPQTDIVTIRRQVIAAIQLDEFWRVDEIPDDNDAEMETLVEYEARCGLTISDRGFMPDGGWLCSLPFDQVQRPDLPPLEVAEDQSIFAPPPPAEPEPQVEMFPEMLPPPEPVPEPVQIVPFVPTQPTEVFPEIASVPTSTQSEDDLMDELLGRELPRPRNPSAAVSTAEPVIPPPPTSPEPRMKTGPRLRVQPGADTAASMLPRVRYDDAETGRRFRASLGQGTLTLLYLRNGKLLRLENVAKVTVADEFLDMEVQHA